jgi:glycosyltransferase involved in cell wall biosynthesis
MHSRIPVSFLMLTLNEELNLVHSLPILGGWADDIVILDSFSTDRTLEVAAKFGARVVQHKFEGHARQWLWGMQHIDFKHEWVFMHDPDHRLMPQLKAELEAMFARGVPADVNGFYVKRRNVFQGKWIRHGGYYPTYMLKLVRRHRVSFDEHEFDYRAYVPERTLTLQHDIIEENLKEEDITFWIDKHNRFAVRQAEEEMYRAQHPGSWKTAPRLSGNPDQRTLWLKKHWYRMPLFVRPFLYFFYRYFLRLGFLDGKKGFIFHFLQAFWYRLIVDVKLEQLRASASTQFEAPPRPRLPP